MASTYSNLKIQLMATGENATTWGNVTNINLGTALEEAIVGSADVTFASANVTLTLTDTNATQTARNMRMRCTGTTGGSTRNLVVPSIEKPYIVQNDCADSIVVKTAAGSGITVPAGKTMWVYSDATNVVSTTTHLASLTLGTALPVASGGTGATDAATARANLGAGVGTVTSVAGTGTVNGLTLTGTVTSSGSLTLGGTLSGVSLTSQVTGTLPVANGGTGGTSQASAQTALDVPSRGGSGASGTWGINISGNAATATSATSATSATTATNAGRVATTNFVIEQVGSELIFKYNGTNVAKISSSGAFTALNNVTGFGSV